MLVSEKSHGPQVDCVKFIHVGYPTQMWFLVEYGLKTEPLVKTSNRLSMNVSRMYKEFENNKEIFY